MTMPRIMEVLFNERLARVGLFDDPERGSSKLFFYYKSHLPSMFSAHALLYKVD